MDKFEQYLQEFTNSIDPLEFVIALLLTALLASLLRIYYIRFGNAISNRRRFAANFLPLALTTMLIITVVKSSIALSLGLVGALSIVRFRAAIKDPEELTYLFLVIGIGLAMGANQVIVGLLAFVIIMALLYLNQRFGGIQVFKQNDSMYLHIQTKDLSLEEVSGLLRKHLPYVKLKRMDSMDGKLEVSFVIKAESTDQIQAIQTELSRLSPEAIFSLVDQPELTL